MPCRSSGWRSWGWSPCGSPRTPPWHARWWSSPAASSPSAGWPCRSWCSASTRRWSLPAGLIGVPGVAGAVLCLATVVTYSRTLAAVTVALLGAVVGLLTCVAFSRAVTTAASSALHSRRGRELGTGVGLLLLVLLGPTISITSERAGSWSGAVDRVLPVLAWTPLGLPWAAGGDASPGHLGTALARLLLAVAVLGLVLQWWSRALQRAAENPRDSGGPGAVSSGLGWFGRLPGTPTGAVTARALTYWRRDPRYL